VARSRRPHRNRCHCRVTNRPRSSPPLVCWGPASHRFRSGFRYVGPRQKYSVGHPVRPRSSGLCPPGVSARPPPVRSPVPTVVGTLVTHGKAGVCARLSINCYSAVELFVGFLSQLLDLRRISLSVTLVLHVEAQLLGIGLFVFLGCWKRVDDVEAMFSFLVFVVNVSTDSSIFSKWFLTRYG
jgi:hypothetical protein